MREDKFTAALCDLSGKRRTGIVLLSELDDPSPLSFIYCLFHSSSLRLPSEIGVCPAASAGGLIRHSHGWEGSRGAWHILCCKNRPSRQRECENLSEGFDPGPRGKFLIKPVNVNISRKGKVGEGNAKCWEAELQPGRRLAVFNIFKVDFSTKKNKIKSRAIVMRPPDDTTL